MNRPLPHVFWLLLTPCAGFAAAPEYHPVSARISAAVSASVPKYVPPAPASPVTAPAPGSTESIILLPRMEVNGSKAPIPGDWWFVTPKGRADFLKKRYPGYVRPGSSADAIDESKPNAAMQLLRDEKRQEKLGWMKDTLDDAALAGDKEAAKKIKKEMQDALYRAYDWRTESLDRAYNNDRR